jgi:hypothetical protein
MPSSKFSEMVQGLGSLFISCQGVIPRTRLGDASEGIAVPSIAILDIIIEPGGWKLKNQEWSTSTP